MSRLLALAMICTGLTVLAAPQAHAAADAVVSGKVVDSVTKQSIARVAVTDSTSGRSTTTAAAGTYSLSLPAGDHVLTATLPGYVPSSTPTLTLTEGRTFTNQGFTLAKYASASGVVTVKGTATGIAAVVVKLYDASTTSPNPEYASTTGPDGSWALDVAPGTYVVELDGTSTQYATAWHGGATRGAAASVTLVAGGVLDVPASLSKISGPTTKVTTAGTVTTQGSAGLAGRVTIDPGGTSAANAVITVYGSDGNTVAYATADGTGRYSVPGLAAGYYIVQASAQDGSGTLLGYLGGAVSRSLARYTTIADGAALSGQDISLQRTATLSGLVTHRGAPQVGVTVGATGMGIGGPSTTSRGDGSFQLSGIPPGTYRLSASYGDQVVWWGGAAQAGGAPQIVVPAAAALTGYSLDLPVRYQLSGTVRTTAGTPAAHAQVYVTDGTQRLSLLADSSGRFAVAVAQNTYELGLLNAASSGVMWSPGSDTPDLVLVTADTVKDLTLPDVRTITTTVKGSDGTVPQSAHIDIYNSRQEFYGGAAATNGNAVLTLPPGVFRLVVTASSYLDLTTQITVSIPTAITLTLEAGGRISGSIGGAPALVTAIDVSTGDRFDRSTGTGPYTLEGLPTGDYVVTAAPVDTLGVPCGWAGWHGGLTYVNARRLHVVAGSSIAGIDATVLCDPAWVPGGNLSVTVWLPASAPAGASAGITVWATDVFGQRWSSSVVDGKYVIPGMPPGYYSVTANHATLSLGANTYLVPVHLGTTTTLGLHLGPRGRVSGRVVGPLGEPLSAVVSDGETSTMTDSSGGFTLSSVTFGVHTLEVGPGPVGSVQVYARTTVDNVTVTAGADVSGLTIRVPLAGSLRGSLPAPGPTEVTLTDSSSRVIDSAIFSGDSFVFFGLPPGPIYARFSGSGIVTEWWKDAPDLARATHIDIPAGGSAIDVTPSLTSAAGSQSVTVINGRVTSTTGPVPGVYVEAAGYWDVTASDGTYSLSVPRGDTYRVEASICLGPSTYPCTGQEFADARTVLADTAAVSGVDFAIPDEYAPFRLTPAPTISGTPVVGEVLTASVSGWVPTPDTIYWIWWADGQSIAGQYAASLTLTADLVGHRVTVSVMGVKTGYVQPTVHSLPTAPVDVAGAIHPLTPSRLLDSRSGLGFSGPARNGTVITLPVWERGGVPSGASAVLVNLTVTEPTAGGFVTAYASGSAVPGVSNANFVAGTTSANLSLVPVGADGAIALKTAVAGSVHVIADVQGYVVGGAVTAAGALVPVTPTRLLDTRSTQRVGPGGTVTLPVTGIADVPADATAAVVNLTVTGPGASGFVTAYPTGVGMPTASNVNFSPGQTVPNLAIVKVGSGQSITVFNAASSPIDLVVDIQGFVTAGTATLPGTVKPVTPTRAVDTRITLGTTGPVFANTGRTVHLSSASGLATTPLGALINLTVTDPRAPGWLAAYPPGVDRPQVSNLNFTAGKTVPNLALATLSNGDVVLYNGSASTVQMVADVLAYVLA